MRIPTAFRTSLLRRLIVLSLVLIPATLLCKKFNVNSILIIVASCLTVAHLLIYKVKVKNDILLYFVVGYFFYLLVFVLKADQMEDGLAIIRKKLPMLILPFLIYLNKEILKHHLQTIFKVFIWSTIIACMYCTYKIYGDWESSEKSARELLTYYQFTSSYFSNKLDIHPGYLSNFILLCILFINLLLKETKEIWKKTILKVAWVYLTLVIIQLASRLQILNYVLSLIVLFFYARRDLQNKRFNKIFVLLLGGAGLLFLLNSNFIVERFKQGIDMYFNEGKNYPQYYEASRMHTWKHVPTQFIKNPIFGAGTGNENRRLYELFLVDNYQTGIKGKLNYHNQYFQELIRSGLIGFFVFLGILTIYLKSAWKKRNMIFLLFMVFNLSFFSFESVLERHRGIVFFFFFASVFYFCQTKETFKKAQS